MICIRLRVTKQTHYSFWLIWYDIHATKAIFFIILLSLLSFFYKQSVVFNNYSLHCYLIIQSLVYNYTTSHINHINSFYPWGYFNSPILFTPCLYRLRLFHIFWWITEQPWATFLIQFQLFYSHDFRWATFLYAGCIVFSTLHSHNLIDANITHKV